MLEKVRIAGIQTYMSWDKKDNIERQLELVNKAIDNGAKIIVLDELSNTIYFPFEQNSKYFSWAETENGETLQKFKEVSKERGISIIVPIFERDGRFFYNTAFVIDKGKVVGKYRKIHLPQQEGLNEYYYFRIGNLGFPVFDVQGVKLGIVICHDRHFPETVRSEVIKGAWLIVIPSVAAWKEIWELELRAHAVFNNSYVIAVNRIGAEYQGQKEEYFGESMIISPMGDIISKARNREEIIYADVSEEEVINAEIKRPFLKKRLQHYEEL